MTEWLRPEDVDAFLLGATLLGSGGGGEARVWSHRVRSSLPAGGMPLLSLEDAQNRGLGRVAVVGMVGATSVLVEKLPHGGEIAEAVGASRRWNGWPVEALMPVEAAGLNAALAVAAAAELDLPLLDVDLMGRALPRFDQLSLVVAGSDTIRSAALAESGGQVLVLDHSTPSMLERAVRAYVSVAGGWAGASFGPVQVSELAGRSCEGTLTRAVRLGQALESVTGSEASTTAVIAPSVVAQALGGLVLGAGRVVEVDRGLVPHLNRSRFTVAARTGPVLRIEAENEYLLVLVDGEPAVTCPELILVLDRRTARPIAVDRLRSGDDVQVIALPGPTWWWEAPERLLSVGPRAFGIDLDPVRLPDSLSVGTAPRVRTSTR
jgi:DUF917 family protein